MFIFTHTIPINWLRFAIDGNLKNAAELEVYGMTFTDTDVVQSHHI